MLGDTKGAVAVNLEALSDIPGCSLSARSTPLSVFLVLFGGVVDNCFKCPMCFESRLRFHSQTWFMRHLERIHGLSRCAALEQWFDVNRCQQEALNER